MFDVIALGVLAFVGLGGGVALLGLAFAYSRDEIAEAESPWDGPTFAEAIRDHLALKKREAASPAAVETERNHTAEEPVARPPARGADERQSRRPAPAGRDGSRRPPRATRWGRAPHAA